MVTTQNNNKHIHILGICGTFMGGIAAIAQSLGYKVTGSDQNVYPPMSTQLEELGIELTQGYDTAQLDPAPDSVVIGNAMSRGNPCVEYVLEKNIPYTSGPEWLKHHLLQDSWVLAVAGTHGKTTTASMLAWILEYAGLRPGFLIGGIVQNFGVSARVSDTPFFVIEADEYDTAFFDKRSKFVHYLPRTLVMNNLEFDHADIFTDLNAIQTQFHHLLRTLPAQGKAIYPADDTALAEVIKRGFWSKQETLNGDWSYNLRKADGSQFEVCLHGQLGQAKRLDIAEEDMPDVVLILSDMEFNQCATNYSQTAMQSIKSKYADCGYKIPNIVFWNLNARGTNIPVKFDEMGTALVSGFSPAILKQILSSGSITPVDVMNRVLNSERYSLINKPS